MSREPKLSNRTPSPTNTQVKGYEVSRHCKLQAAAQILGQHQVVRSQGNWECAGKVDIFRDKLLMRTRPDMHVQHVI